MYVGRMARPLIHTENLCIALLLEVQRRKSITKDNKETSYAQLNSCPLTRTKKKHHVVFLLVSITSYSLEELVAKESSFR